MNVRMLNVLTIGLMLATGVAGKTAGANDEDKIQGTWSPVLMEKGGNQAPAEKLKALKVTFAAGGKVTAQEEDKLMEADFKLNPAKQPKEADFTIMESGKEEVHKGIYELAGDTLKICWSHPPEERPTEFTTQANSSRKLIVLKRDKK